MQTQLPKILGQRNRAQMSISSSTQSSNTIRSETVKSKTKFQKKMKSTVLSVVDHNKFNKADCFKNAKLAESDIDIVSTDRSLFKFQPEQSGDTPEKIRSMRE